MHFFAKSIVVVKFLSFIFHKIGRERVFGNVLDRKLSFLDSKNIGKEIRKKSFHDFGQKSGISSYFFFRQNRPRKSVW